MHRLPFVLFMVGCATDSGALGNTSISTECSPTDFACVTAGLDGPVAVGGVVPLSVDIDIPGTSSTSMTLLAADPTVLKTAGTEITGMAPGMSALVMLSETSAIDFLHIFVVAPTRLGLHRHEDGLAREELTEDIELLVGDELVIDLEPYKDSQRLLGHTSTEWRATTAGLSVLRDGAANRRRIVARTAGEVDLIVSAFGFEKTLHIEVLP